MVEGTGLENRHAVKRIEGSNPSFSARENSSRFCGLFSFDRKSKRAFISKALFG